MNRTPLLFLLAFSLIAGACDDKGAGDGAQGPSIQQITGTVTVGGKAAKATGCKAIAEQHGTALELTFDTGLVVTSSPMDGLKAKKGDGAAASLDCERNASKMSSGKSAAGAWTTGQLGLTCKHPDGDIVADLEIDCGVTDRPSNAKP